MFQIPAPTSNWPGVNCITADTLQHTQRAFRGCWNNEVPSFFCPRRLRRIVSLLEFLCWEAEDKLSGWTPIFRDRPLLGFLTAGPELDSSNVLLKLAIDILSASWAFAGSLGGVRKLFGSMPVFPELEGERVPGGLLPYDSRTLNPSALLFVSSSRPTSLGDVTGNGKLLLAISLAISEGLPNTVLVRVSEGTASGEFRCGHESSSKT